MRYFAALAGLAVLLNSSPVCAESESCSAISSPRDVVRCSLENHPDIRRSALARSQSQHLESAARQIPNPEVDGKYGFKSLANDAPVTTEIALMQTIEIGGKRSGRIDRARAELGQSEASLQRAQEEVATQTLLSLHRLRQLEEELLVLSETIDTFRKQSRILRGRPALTPEQDVSLSVFSFAAEDGELKRTLMESEKQSLIMNLQIAMGSAISYSKSWLPSEPSTWPELSADRAPAQKFSAVRLIQSERDLAQADLNLARSEAWPDFKLGPFFESELSGGVRTSALGVQIAFALPIFNQNGGAKAVAQAGMVRAEESLKITQNALQSERQRELLVYQASVSQLKKSFWHQQYEKRHQKVEALFSRGVLASPVVIEAHRQVLEVQKTSHELELKALESLYRIRVIDGIQPEEML